MKHIKSETEQITPVNSECTGIFSVLQQSVADFNETQQTFDEDYSAFIPQPGCNFMINLTEIEQNLKYSSEFQPIFNSKDNEACDQSFNSTMSATEIDNNMDLEEFAEKFDAENIDDLAELMKLTEEFPLLDELMDEELAAAIEPEFQHPVPEMTQIEDIKPLMTNPVKIPILDENKKFIREEFNCLLCQKNFTAYTSLTRHYKTQRHQRMEAAVQSQGLVYQVQPKQNISYIQQAQTPIVPQSKANQKRMNFIKKTRDSRNQIVDHNRITTVEHEEILDIQQVCSNTEATQEFQTSPKISPNATKTAIENSIKILSKINTEQALKEESSPKKQNSMKQLTLTGMAFSKPTEANAEPKQQSELEFDLDAEALLDTFTPEPESELAKYFQSNLEDIFQSEPQEEVEEQPIYQVFYSSDSIFTISEISAQEQTQEVPKTGLARIMAQKKQQRIQRDISSSPSGCFKCEYCPKTFSTQSNMRRHEHLHASKKQHSCKVCGKAFMQKEYLKKHMVTH